MLVDYEQLTIDKYNNVYMKDLNAYNIRDVNKRLLDLETLNAFFS